MALIGGSGEQNELYVYLVNGDILMVLRPNIIDLSGSAWKFARLVSETSIMEPEFTEFTGMSCSTPINPFKSRNPFTPESDSIHLRIIIQLICLHTTASL